MELVIKKLAWITAPEDPPVKYMDIVKKLLPTHEVRNDGMVTRENETVTLFTIDS